MVDKLRGTGRTTRMLEEALRLSNKRHAVYVVGVDVHHARELEKMLDTLNPPEDHGIKFESAQILPTFDWVTMTLKGAHPNCRVLVNRTIESKYVYMLEMLHAFDPEE